MWKTVKLADIATVIAGQSPKGEHYNKEERGTPFYQGKKDYGERYLNEPTVWTDVVTKLAEKDDILISVRAPVGALNIATQKICIGRGLAAIRPSTEILHDYLFYSLLLISHQVEGSAGAIFNSINKAQIEAIEISLPPLAEQERIIAKLDAAFAKIEAFNKQVSIKKSELIKLKKALLLKTLSSKKTDLINLGDVCELIYGKGLDKTDRLENGGIPAYGANGIKAYSTKILSDEPSIIIGRKGSAGELTKVSSPFWALDVTYYTKINKELINLDFLYYTLRTMDLPSMAKGVKPGINRNDVYKRLIYLPTLEKQNNL